MTSYLLLYLAHVAAVFISGLFFLVRGVWMLMDSPLLNAKLTRIVPHVVDTLLLLAAIGLCVVTQQYPFADDWLTVKVVALLAYIAFGMFALRRGKTRNIRATFFVLALLSFGFMVSVALTRHPLGVFSLV